MERLAYTPAEIATAAGLSRKAIYRAIENGELRAAKVCNGSRLLIPSEAAREWIDRNLVTPRSEPRSGHPFERSRHRARRVFATAPGMAPEGVAPTRPTRYPAAQRGVAGSVVRRGARAKE
jgi:excisionase family DNA binding protein